MDYIESSVVPGEPLAEHFIRELHVLTVRSLERKVIRTRARTGLDRFASRNRASST